MTKGYWIARVDVSDEAGYKSYIAANAKAFAKFEGRFIVRGGPFENPEGQARKRNVVIEFPSYDAALACYRSAEYAEASSFRTGAAQSDLIIIAGYDGPQPGA